jgi:hypothetical protein
LIPESILLQSKTPTTVAVVCCTNVNLAANGSAFPTSWALLIDE